MSSSDSRQSDAPQFSVVRETLSDLGMAMTLSWETHQLSAAWAGVFRFPSATSRSAFVPFDENRPASAASLPLSSGV